MRLANSSGSAWTDPKQLTRWWAPNGFSSTFQEFDVRPGGTWRFFLHGPDGKDYKNTIIYQEIVKPERIVSQHVSARKFIEAHLVKVNSTPQV